MLNSIEKRFEALKAEISDVVDYCYNRGYLGVHLHEAEITEKLKELEQALDEFEDDCINEQY